MTTSPYSDGRVREWARDAGYSVGERGRLPLSVHEAFKRAYPSHVLPGEEVAITYCDECWTRLPAHTDYCSQRVPAIAAETIPAPAVTVDTAPEILPAGNPAPALSDATAALTSALEALTRSQAPAVDETLVRKIARDEAETAILAVAEEFSRPKIVHVHVKDRETVVFEERTHAEFENVLKLLARKRNVYMYGPPGTGKSTIAVQAAKAMGLPYGDISCEPTMPASRLFGFIDANGIFRDPLFFRIFTEGGIWNWEEIDNGHPGITAAMNTALANGHCTFPHGVFPKSENFYCTATANTHGLGATRQFVGRNQLDAATLDRFVEWEIGIDEEIEELGVLAEITDAGKGREWLTKVREWRSSAAQHNLNVIISPRGAMNGAVMLDEGFSWEQAAKACIFKGMDKGTRDKIERGY